MSNLILPPKHKSVLTPEKEYEARYKSLDTMRDTLFVGAVMGMAEFIHKSDEHIALRSVEEQQRAGIATVVGAANAIMDILDLCIQEKWNVAVEILNWQKTYIANKIKEKMSGELTEGVQTSAGSATSSGTDSDRS